MNLPPRRNLLISTLAALVLLAGCGKESGPVMLRKDFEAAVMGKTPDEVLAAVGRPDETVQMPGEDTWFYRGKVKDPITGNVSTAIVAITKGRVSRVVF